jgi:molecular chaperone DnaJ
MIDYYKILGVSKTATTKEIKKAYRQLSKKYHPDLNPDNPMANELFKQLSEAHNVLSDNELRRKYDSPRQTHRRVSYEDIFRAENIKNNRPQLDIHLSIDITLEEVLNGTNKIINYNRKSKCVKCRGYGGSNGKTCESCHGHGSFVTRMGPFNINETCNYCNGMGVIYENKCTTCGGNGNIDKKENLQINIPPGIENGQIIRYQGNGNITQNGVGDLLIKVNVLKHPIYNRESRNLITDVEVDYPTMIMGGYFELTLLDKTKIRIKIPEYSKPNDILRIIGKGIMIMGSQSGDLLIRISLKEIKELSAEQRNILNLLKNTL